MQRADHLRLLLSTVARVVPPPGKTSTILAMARELYGPELVKKRVLELNASNERGIDVIRQSRHFRHSRPLRCRCLVQAVVGKWQQSSASHIDCMARLLHTLSLQLVQATR